MLLILHDFQKKIKVWLKIWLKFIQLLPQTTHWPLNGCIEPYNAASNYINCVFQLYAIMQIEQFACLEHISALQGRSKIDNWWRGGGLICIYSCSAQLISFEIDCFYGV